MSKLETKIKKAMKKGKVSSLSPPRPIQKEHEFMSKEERVARKVKRAKARLKKTRIAIQHKKTMTARQQAGKPAQYPGQRPTMPGTARQAASSEVQGDVSQVLKKLKQNPGLLRGATRSLKALGPIGSLITAFSERHLSRSQRRKNVEKSIGVRTLTRNK